MVAPRGVATERNLMTVRRWLTMAALVGVSFAGGVVGATMIGTANAATSPSTPSSSTPAATQGRWHSNTDPKHEAGESAARAAEEKAADASGIAPEGFGRGGHSNTDPAHEAGESAARAAQEKAEDAAGGTTG